VNVHVQLKIASGENDVHEETKHEHLAAIGFVRGMSEQDQWFLLVAEAWKNSKLPMNEYIRDYLATMLYRFMRRADLFEKLSFFDYCQHLLGVKKVDAPCVQDAADMSLQYVAFFPERGRYRHEPRSIGYSAEIGVGLYRELARQAEGKDDWFSNAYRTMADSFGQAVLVLRSACPRFALRKDAHDSLKERGLQFMSDHQAAEVVRHVSQFALMYAESNATTRSVQ
jgi:hypothetical protein